MSARRDMILSPEDFDVIAKLAYRESGLQLVREKSSMIQSRLRHRVNALGLDDFHHYTKLVCSEAGRPEVRHMISALTTNVSHFFREEHHFRILEEKIVPGLNKKMKSGERVRIWSAGCSNGQEGYSIAMTLLKSIPDLHSFDVKILGTDIDPKVVAFARQAKYPERLITGVPQDLLNLYFEESTESGDRVFTAGDSLRKLLSFNELNLLAKWPMKHEFDVIFCRNVVIYFDLETQNALWPRFRQALSRDGYMFLGHSERINDHQHVGFITDGPTTYRPSAKN
ncbi:protein-glutamate O-methyltransferase CheR [uncultured Roseobacter sp.]|uniref:CheR family methyltransferase n=1 Tax=uncultured Roseobacter sp. TaxID=114847 RepID=UPI00262161E7|nr:protein-glutamate O-methyltransferase [uncultured Roseobacter sp.]